RSLHCSRSTGSAPAGRCTLSLHDALPILHRVFLEQVQDESFEVALAEEVEETAELFRGAHDDNSFRRNQRVASSPPTIAYAAKTRREVAGSGTNPSPPPPGPGRTVAPPSTLVMIPDRKSTRLNSS